MTLRFHARFERHPVKIRTILLASLCAWLAACATATGPAYRYNEIRVVNRSVEIVRDVNVRVVGRAIEFACGDIAPRGQCTRRFGSRRYRFDPIRVEWRFAGRPRQVRDFVIPVPSTLYSGAALNAVLEISPNGTISTRFEQNTPTS